MAVRGLAIHAFVPSGPDFELALRFFASLGFEAAWRHDGLAGLRFGGAYFLLQHITVTQWQENQMLILDVDDLDAYWRDIEAMELPSTFIGVKVRPPTDFPWGREVHLIDPAGVCWHIRQAASGS